MPSRLFCAAMLAVTLGFFPDFALAAGNVASVSYERLIREAPQTAASEDLVKHRYAPREKAIRQQREKVKSLLERYQSLDAGSNSLERASAAQTLAGAQKKLGRIQSQYASARSLLRRQLQTNFRAVVAGDIQTYARAHGYTLVIDQDVVYAAPATDITDKILAMLKKQYRKVQAQSKNSGHGR